MPGRCQDGVFDGDQGLEFTDASGQAPVAGAEGGGVLGAVGCHRGDTEGAGEPVVAVSGVCGFVSFTGLVESGATPAQEARCPGVGKRLMSAPVSAMITSATPGPTPGMVSRRARGSRKGAM